MVEQVGIEPTYHTLPIGFALVEAKSAPWFASLAYFLEFHPASFEDLVLHAKIILILPTPYSCLIHMKLDHFFLNFIECECVFYTPILRRYFKLSAYV